MSNLIPFDSTSKLPAYLKKAGPLNEDLTTGVGSSFPFLSIKGKVFTLVKGNDRRILHKPSDPDEPATSIEVVILKANANLSKVWYKDDFSDGQGAKPDCFSNDGKKPDASVASPVNKTCADCPKNAWGSSGHGNAKACTDTRRIAVAPAGQVNDPMLIRVPPASLKPLAEFAEVCNKRGVPYNAVVTKIKFDPAEATPKLVFVPVGFLTEEQFAVVEETAKGDVVAQIIGTKAMPKDEDAAAFETATPPKNAVKAKAVEAEEDAPAPAPKKAKPKVEEDEDAPAPAPKAKPAASSLTAELDAMLGGSDD